MLNRLGYLRICVKQKKNEVKCTLAFVRALNHSCFDFLSNAILNSNEFDHLNIEANRPNFFTVLSLIFKTFG